MICGKDGPYNYLPASVGNFPPPPEMLALMRTSGLSRMRMAAVHLWHRRVVHRRARTACSLKNAMTIAASPSPPVASRGPQDSPPPSDASRCTPCWLRRP